MAHWYDWQGSTKFTHGHAMKISTSTIFETYLFLLFPGFFFYHVAHSLGYAPYFGWFGAFIAAGVAVIIAKSTFSAFKGNPYINYSHLVISAPAAIFFILTASTIAINHLFNDSKYINLDGLVWNITNILLMLGFYLIGKKLNIRPGKKYKVALLASYLLFSYFTYTFYNSFNNTIVLPASEDSSGDIASYQSMAMCVLYTMIAICPFINSRKQKTTLLLSSILILYFIGSRTEFFLLCAITPIYIYINYGKKTLIAISLMASIAISYGIVTFGVNDRFASTINEFQSTSARTELMVSGVKGITENPLMGDYLGQVRIYGSTGAYIHNALSAFQQYGLFAFSLYIYLAISSAIIGIRYVKYAKNNVKVEILIYSSVISLLGIIISKSIGWPLPALAWGVACIVLSDMSRARMLGKPTSDLPSGARCD